MADSEPESPSKPLPPLPPENPPARREPEHFRGLFEGRESDNEPETKGPQRWWRQRKKQRSEMGFFEHLEELRMTIIKCAMAATVGMAITSTFFVKFFNLLRYPLDTAIGQNTDKVQLISISPMGVISMVISVSVYGGVLLALPVMVYFVVQFVAPGLTSRERGMLRPAMLSAMVLFVLGALACFFVLLPAGLRANFYVSGILDIHNEINVPEYYSLVVWATLGVGLAFEFPLILVILQVLGIVEPATLRRSRRYAIVIIAVASALLAPAPSVDSMLLTMVPMMLLFEGSIVVGALLRGRKLAADARREAANAG
ncbi:MAG TPA: twin-arginine translocase subunit TatC [Opitutales bacterium]|nr:twin-arginine translocase subunit TatC [Opitutales bacterium]